MYRVDHGGTPALMTLMCLKLAFSRGKRNVFGVLAVVGGD